MKAIDAADYIIYLLNDCCDDITNMKLNKILFFAQGFCLKQMNRPLFEDAIEAWEHGPVIPTVYHRYKAYHNDPIHNWDESAVKRIADEDRELIFNVAREFSQYTAAALRNMTHVPQGVWAKYYTPGERHAEIPQTAIREYFIRYEGESRPIILNITDDDCIGYRDEEGFLVLPEDWND